MEFVRIKLHGRYGNGKWAIVDGDYDGEYFSQFRWYVSPAGYVVRRDYRVAYRGYIYLHQEVAGAKKGLVVDHIDRDKLNNRSCNLRLVTQQTNMLNRVCRDLGKTYEDMTQDDFTKLSEIQKKRGDTYRKSPKVRVKKADYDRKRYLLKKQESQI